MRTSALLFALILLSQTFFLTGCSGSAPVASTAGAPSNTAVSEAEPYGVVLNITSGKDDLHAVSMAVALATHSLEHGHHAVIFLNVHAPELAVRDLGDDVKYADFPPVKQMFSTFMEKGGTLYACEHCTTVCGVDRQDLLDGIIITQHGQLLEDLKSNSLVFSY